MYVSYVHVPGFNFEICLHYMYSILEKILGKVSCGERYWILPPRVLSVRKLWHDCDVSPFATCRDLSIHGHS